MSLPNANITYGNGGLGLPPETNDGIAGIIVTGVAITGDNAWAVGVAKSFTGLSAVEAAGITAAYDTANETNAYKQISDFYAEAGQGKKLWVLIAPASETLTDICDQASTNKYAKNLLDAANKTIRILGICRKPASAYSPVFTSSNTINDEIIAALPKLEALATAYHNIHAPFRAIMEGIYFKGGAPVPALNSMTYPHCGLVIGDYVQDKSACVGAALGRMAKNPVQRKISRVKDGSLQFTKGYISKLTDTTWSYTELKDSDIDGIHSAGAITLREFANKTGIFFTGAPSCVAKTNDYSLLNRGLVIDKAHIIAYQTYVEEIEDDIEILEGGLMEPSVIKGYEITIESNISLSMQSKGEISNVDAEIDPTQNVGSTDEVNIKLRLRPKGYATDINVDLGFTLQ